jgi:hypothetical protein
MKLNKKQKEILLEWIAEGLQSDEINKRAAAFKPSFQVIRQQVDFYRKTRGVDIDKLRKEGEFTALNTGLSVKEKRVALLQQLAEKMRLDIFENDLLWTNQVKGIGGADNFERIDYQEFNAAEVQQLRGVLDDIAAELNERSKKLEHSGPNGGPIPIFDMEAWKKERLENLEKIKILEE